MEGRWQTRRAFVEYRAQFEYGEGDQGVYTKVRYGPVEVFLLDTRWFANLEPSESRADAPSCLGSRQRQWLLEGLRASTAPFKLLVSGMVWHDKGGRSQDDWETFAVERDELFAFLGREGIGGCLLLGGDVHACQHSVFDGTEAGYALHELVVSPLHERAWRGGDRGHAARRWGVVRPHVFLLLDADTTGAQAGLTATWMDAAGASLHRVELAAQDLAPKR